MGSDIVALDVGFPGAGRVLKELSILSKGGVLYNPTDPQHWDSPSLLFLPAWHPEYPGLIDSLKPARTVLIWTSPPLQSELVPEELEYLKVIIKLLDTRRLHAIWLGSNAWLPMLQNGERKVFYCPYPVSIKEKCVQDAKRSETDNVSLFGPLHPRKNVVIQAIAAKDAGVTLHITDSSGIPTLDTVGCKYVSHGWLPESEYDMLVASMDLGLQVSVPGCESFGYTAWDHLVQGIPCLTSTPWGPPAWLVGKPLDPQYLATRIRANLRFPKPVTFLEKWTAEFARDRNIEVAAILGEKLDLSL